MHHRSATRFPALLLVGLAACASTDSKVEQSERKEALTSWIERVHVESERSRQAISDSFERLNVLAAGRFQKEPAAVVYAKFVQAADSAEQQAKRFQDVVGPMLETAPPVFTQWQADVKSMNNERFRQIGETRYAVAKERYDAITKNAVPARDKFDAYVKALRDHAAFLANDLNASALDVIQDEVKAVARTARELDRAMESCQAAARAFVAESSLPAAPGR